MLLWHGETGLGWSQTGLKLVQTGLSWNWSKTIARVHRTDEDWSYMVQSGLRTDAEEMKTGLVLVFPKKGKRLYQTRLWITTPYPPLPTLPVTYAAQLYMPHPLLSGCYFCSAPEHITPMCQVRDKYSQLGKIRLNAGWAQMLDGANPFNVPYRHHG